MYKLHLSSNLYKQKPNPKMSHPFPQTKEKQEERTKKKKKERNEGKKLGRRIKADARANSTSSP